MAKKGFFLKKYNFISAFLLICFMHICFASFSYAQNRAVEIRTGKQSDDVYRVVVEVNNKVNWKHFILKSPDRLVIDIPNTNVSSIRNKTQKMPGIKEIRMGNFENTTARFVFELTGQANVVKTLFLPTTGTNNWRIVIDFSIDGNKSSSYQENQNNYTANNNENERTVQISAPLRRDKFIVVIDPGHGGKDPGAIGISGIQEKTIVLEAGKLLRNKLLKDKRFKVIMTRDTDVFVTLQRRAQIGEENNADLFISIHADSHPQPSTMGLSVYTLSDKATDAEAQKLANKENAADLIGVDDLKGYAKPVISILSDVAQSLVKEASVLFGDALVKEINKTNRIKSLPNRPLREAPFYVLKSSVPSALVELGYLSNKTEESLLRTNDYRDDLADAMYKAIVKTLE